MIKKLAITFFTILSPGYLHAQYPVLHTDHDSIATHANFRKTPAPSYISLVLDWGLDFLSNPSQNMQTSFFKTKGPNVSMYYNIPIQQSHFLLSPGIAIGGNSYGIKDEYTLVRIGNDTNRQTSIEKANKVFIGSPTIKSSNLDIMYLDVIAECSFHTNLTEPRNGFFIALGGSVGLYLDSYTTIKYMEDEQTKTRFTKESFNLNKIRSGIIIRGGWHRFGVFYSQTLTNLFNQKGPTDDVSKPFSIGLSISLL